jgi:hypothetical protein
MELELECTCRATLKPPVIVGNGPFGLRMVIEVISGELKGPRVSAKVLSAGADWVLVGSDGWGYMDVRTQFETTEGALIYAQYHGIIEMNEAVTQAFLTGAETDYDDHYFRVIPRLETGDPGLAWVNRTAFVGEGRFVSPGPALEYRMYRVS